MSLQYRAMDERLNRGVELLRAMEKPNVAAVARQLSVNRSTLSRRFRGGASKSTRRPGGCRLHEEDERALLQHIVSLRELSGLPTKKSVESSANYLLNSRHELDAFSSAPVLAGATERRASARTAAAALPPFAAPSTSLSVGKCWTKRFMNRYKLSLVKRKSLEKARVYAHDRENLLRWYKELKEVMDEHGIGPDSIWNMDETGCRIGVGGASQVVSTDPSDVQWAPNVINRESVTVIEAVCANGQSIPPMVITAGAYGMLNLHRAAPPGYALRVSPNAYIDDLLALEWLQHFLYHTRNRPGGAKKLLLLDNHTSHTTVQFAQCAAAHGVILFFLVPHASHLLQPLDVGVFQPYKHWHRKVIDHYVSLNVLHFDKVDFIAELQGIRQNALVANTIKSGFRRAGIWPHNPMLVIDKLPQAPGERSAPANETVAVIAHETATADVPETPRTQRTRSWLAAKTPRTPRQLYALGGFLKDLELTLENIQAMHRLVLKYTKGAMFQIRVTEQVQVMLTDQFSMQHRQARRRLGGRTQFHPGGLSDPACQREIHETRLRLWQTNTAQAAFRNYKDGCDQDLPKGLRTREEFVTAAIAAGNTSLDFNLHFTPTGWLERIRDRVLEQEQPPPRIPTPPARPQHWQTELLDQMLEVWSRRDQVESAAAELEEDELQTDDDEDELYSHDELDE